MAAVLKTAAGTGAGTSLNAVTDSGIVAPPDRIARTQARLVHGLKIEDVPPHIALRARHLMLDAFGCALASRREEYAARYFAAVCDLTGVGANSPNATRDGRGVIGYAARLPMRDAALMNGVLAHGLDYDDTHMAGVIHLTVSVLPAVLALGGERNASGRDVLTAYIAGLEAGARIASVVKSGLHAHGFHPTGVVGAFASALAAGKLIGLNVNQLVQAQGIALSLASGSLQFIEDGSWTKRLHPGWAAQAGITAAVMASHGIVAPRAPYEGRFGFYRIYLGQDEHARIDPALALAGLTDVDSDMPHVTRWELENIAVKPFPMCHFVHASIDAAIALRAQGVNVAGVRSIEVRVPAGVVPAVCEPQDKKRRPQSDYDAKFSLPYAVVSGLMRGRLGLAELTPQAFQDPAACALMDRVTYAVDSASTFPQHYTGEVRVTLLDGRTVTHRESINRGHAERPLSNDDVVEKYRANATLNFSAAHAEAVRTEVLALDELKSIRTLEDLLAREP